MSSGTNDSFYFHSMQLGTDNFVQSLFLSLNTNQLYDIKSSPDIGGVLQESETTASRIISKIIHDGGTMLYDKYLDEKLHDHSLSLNTLLLEKVMLQEHIFYDDLSSIPEQQINEDLEPVPSHHENWKSLSIVMQKQQAPPSNVMSLKEIDKDTLSIYSRKSVFPERFKKTNAEFGNSQIGNSSNKFNSTKKSEVDKGPKLVDMSIPRELVREEEQLRVLKEREALIKQEKLQLEAIRIQEQKEQQARLRGMQDLNKKQFTYDFDGKLILTNPVKVEKLPPFSYSINTNVSKADTKLNMQTIGTANANKNSDNLSKQNSNQNSTQVPPPDAPNMDQRNSKRLLQPLQFQTELQSREKQTAQQFYTAGDRKEVFEQFKMANGVTLIDPIKSKMGPKFGANLDYSALNQSSLNITLSQEGQSIRMTRDEYNNVIKSGNLIKSQPQLFIKSEKPVNITFDESLQDNNPAQSHYLPNGVLSALNNSRAKSNNINNSIRSIGSNGRKKNISSSQHVSANIIVIDKIKLLESMNNIDLLSEEQKKELEAAKAKTDRIQTDQKIKFDLERSYNPIDEFNRLVSENKHVSDKSSNQYNLPPIIAPKTNEFQRAKQSIGYLPQNPRERAPKHVIIANLTQVRLPPPAMGKTIGHGLNDGIQS